ncbi:PspA/IM30 family protein [Paenibacillus cremeus]|nr:PspA/IM30 family protein [Paenibacillus cremeus]
MGILKRIKQIAAADLNKYLDSFEDPISMVNQYMREIEEQLDKAKAALAGRLVVEKSYEVLVEQTKEVIGKRTRQANLAVDRGEEEIALLALQEKIIHEEKLQVYLEQLATVKQQTAALSEELNKLTDICNELQTRRQFLLSRTNAAEAIQRTVRVQNTYNSESILRGFARMEEKVWRMETGAQASREVSRLARPDGLGIGLVSQAAFSELERLKAERNV